jgi:hypothetical protein
MHRDLAACSQHVFADWLIYLQADQHLKIALVYEADQHLKTALVCESADHQRSGTGVFCKPAEQHQGLQNAASHHAEGLVALMNNLHSNSGWLICVRPSSALAWS